jgi:hypothetical protein
LSETDIASDYDTMCVLTTWVVAEQPKSGLERAGAVSYRELIVGDTGEKVQVKSTQSLTLNNAVDVQPCAKITAVQIDGLTVKRQRPLEIT